MEHRVSETRSRHTDSGGRMSGSDISGSGRANHRMSQALAESLKQVDLFATLDDQALRAVAGVCRIRHYASGQPVLSQGDAGTDVYFVVDGELRATLYSPTGREVAFEELPIGSVFGELAAIDSGPRATTVLALSDATLAVMSAEGFKVMLKAHPGIGLVVLERLTQLVRRLCDRVFEYTTLDVSQRVQSELLRLAQGKSVDGNSIVIDDFPTHAEFANRISTHREAVTRAINALERRSLISRSSGQLVICDYRKLAEIVGELRSN